MTGRRPTPGRRQAGRELPGDGCRRLAHDLAWPMIRQTDPRRRTQRRVGVRIVIAGKLAGGPPSGQSALQA